RIISSRYFLISVPPGPGATLFSLAPSTTGEQHAPDNDACHRDIPPECSRCAAACIDCPRRDVAEPRYYLCPALGRRRIARCALTHRDRTAFRAARCQR